MYPDHRASRSLFQPRLLLFCTLFLIVLFTYTDTSNNNLDFEEALFLTRNSLKELKEQYLPSKKHHKVEPESPVSVSISDNDINNITPLAYDIDYPLNNAVNSFLPIDSQIQYNITSPSGNVTTHEVRGRYAAFSPILTRGITGNYRILHDGACAPIDNQDKELNDKILIVLRGNCTFVDKVSNIIESDLSPRAIIVANDEPYRGLITMFSNTFNSDGSLRIPIMFISFEAYTTFLHLQSSELLLELSTASFGSWFNIMLSMVLSPPLLILIFYLVIICGQKLRRRQLNIRNSKLVRELPVYVFNNDHLIEANHLNHYLKVTGQTVTTPSKDDSLLDSPKTSNTSSSSLLNRIVINGIDIRESAKSLHVLTAPGDFFPAYKCSICLDKYTSLSSRVLILDCKHFYHEKCLSNWLINFKRSCPLCNTVITDHNDSLLAGQDRSYQYGSTDDDLEAQNFPLMASSSSEAHHLHNYPQYPVVEPVQSQASLNTTSSVLEADVEATSEEEQREFPFFEYSPYHVQEEPSTFLPGNGPSSVVESQVSDSTSFYSATSEIDDRPPLTGVSSSRRFYSKPSHILSQFSSASTLNQANARDLSVSIDTGNFATPPQGSPQSNDINELGRIPSNGDSTIDLSSNGTDSIHNYNGTEIR